MTQHATEDAILVAADGSEPSNHAVGWAANEARRRGATLFVVHVFPSDFRGPESDRAAIQTAVERLLTTAADRARQVLGEAAVRQELLDGPTDEALVARSKDFSLLVVGSRGHGGFATLLLGSTSANLASHAHCPVAVVRGTPGESALPDSATEDPPATGTTQEGPIAVGVDKSPWTEPALGFAFARAAERGVHVLAVAAWQPPTAYGAYAAIELMPSESDDIERDVQHSLSEALEPWQRRYPEVEVEQRTVTGHAVTALVEASQEAQFLVVGSRGRGTLKGMLLGSVSHGALHHARSTIIVVR